MDCEDSETLAYEGLSVIDNSGLGLILGNWLKRMPTAKNMYRNSSEALRIDEFVLCATFILYKSIVFSFKRQSPLYDKRAARLPQSCYTGIQ
jgi:hypothetical protein